MAIVLRIVTLQRCPLVSSVRSQVGLFALGQVVVISIALSVRMNGFMKMKKPGLIGAGL